LGRSTTTSLLLGAALAISIGWVSAGCGDRGIGSCDEEPDVSGTWTLALSAISTDGGTASIPRQDTLTAKLEQIQPKGVLDLGRLVYGTITSSDPGFFGTLTIPRLTQNDGSKTGALLGCALQVNVPIASMVSDDDQDQGPLRLSLAGTLTAPGKMAGDPTRSTLIMVEDSNMTPRSFAWTGTQSR
jgi:hypothetical protein